VRDAPHGKRAVHLLRLVEANDYTLEHLRPLAAGLDHPHVDAHGIPHFDGGITFWQPPCLKSCEI
jgi:hypothetical protein